MAKHRAEGSKLPRRTPGEALKNVKAKNPDPVGNETYKRARAMESAARKPEILKPRPPKNGG
jgi:hypothetical protein